MKIRRNVWLLVSAGLLVSIGLFTSVSRQEQQIRQEAAGNFPHVIGTKIVDGSGRPLVLRGAMMESSFAYINRWNKGEDPTATLNNTTFRVMQSWHMNALRINISQWIYNLNPTLYMQKLDQVVGQANQAGLFVIIDFHNDGQSGAVKPGGYLYPENLAWWKTLASHYRSNSMLLFDLINEPNYPDWNTWLNGGTFADAATGQAVSVVGIPAVISAIRSVGAQQMIVVEPGNGGGKVGGWYGYPDTLSDPNIVFSKHDYSKVISGNPPAWDTEWGPVLNHHPLYYGEWAVLANPYWPSHCTGLTSANADHVINVFLQYLQSRNANWTYWDFKPYELIQDYSTFLPTNYQTGAPWSCPNGVKAGAGVDIKNFLASTSNPTPTVTGKPAPTPSVHPTPTFTPRPTPTITPIPPGETILSFTVLLDGIGSAGDSTNPRALGNPTPFHQLRNIYVGVYDRVNKLVGTYPSKIIYNPKAGDFLGQTAVNNLPTGLYIVKVKADQYLRKTVSGIQTITAKRVTQLPLATLVAGDVNGDNVLNILDYNILMGCYSDLHPAVSCTAAQKVMADLNDDTKVNQVDYNLFLRELGTRTGD